MRCAWGQPGVSVLLSSKIAQPEQVQGAGERKTGLHTRISSHSEMPGFAMQKGNMYRWGGIHLALRPCCHFQCFAELGHPQRGRADRQSQPGLWSHGTCTGENLCPVLPSEPCCSSCPAVSVRAALTAQLCAPVGLGSLALKNWSRRERLDVN